MKRPGYLSKYMFDWGPLEVVLGGDSALDTNFFIGPIKARHQVDDFLKEYGFLPDDPVTRAELYGNFQESLQFIKKYFLKEGGFGHLDLEIPHSFYRMTDVGELILTATGNRSQANQEEVLWAEIILKVMHTILHTDKDLRSNYLYTIQTQIFDRFYRYLYREKSKSENEQLFLGEKDGESIPIVGFETKSQKSRDSSIIKLLHKAENVAEELFDHIGLRIITQNRFDTMRVLRFLIGRFVIITHNIKPSRSLNTLVDIKAFKFRHRQLVRRAIKEEWDEKALLEHFEKEIRLCGIKRDNKERNLHSSESYRSIQFTHRQLIKYTNPFLTEFHSLKNLVKSQGDSSELAKRVLSLDISHIEKEIRFFFPYEVQIVDIEAHEENSKGDASHQEYKKSQIQWVIKRVFKKLLVHKGLAK